MKGFSEMVLNEKSAILVVIYNMKTSESPALKKIIEFAKTETKIIIYDNSLNSMLDISLADNMFYFHDKSNLGLYSAYNKAVKLCRDDGIKWLTFFDQDTSVNADYFKELETKKKECDESVACIVPKIALDNEKTISPFYIEKNLFLRSNDKPTLAAINSGTTINIDAFERKNVFSEEFPLDFLDYEFFKKISEDKLNIAKLQCTLVQDLSVRNYNNMSTQRFENVIRFEKKFIKKHYSKYYVQYQFKLLYRIAKLLVQHFQIKKVVVVMRIFRR